jgi:hypothetical protein
MVESGPGVRAPARGNTFHLGTKGGKTRQESSDLANYQKAKNKELSDVQITANGHG